MSEPLRTSAQISKQLGLPPWRIRHVLDSRSHIKPVLVAASTRLYDEKAVQQISNELKAIAAKRVSQVKGLL